METLGRAAFCNCRGLSGNLVLPESIKNINDDVFYNCKNISGSLYIPDGLEFSRRVITGTNVSAVSVSENNELYSVMNDMLFSKDFGTFIFCPPGKVGELVIPDTVTRIEDSACSNCSGLHGVLTLPDGLKYIGKWAFMECNSFEGDLIIPDTVETIGYAAFAGAFKIIDWNEQNRMLHLPNNLKNLEDWAFTNCGISGTVSIPDGIVTIEFDSDGDKNDQLFMGNNIEFFECSCDNNIFIEHINRYVGTGVTEYAAMLKITHEWDKSGSALSDGDHVKCLKCGEEDIYYIPLGFNDHNSIYIPSYLNGVSFKLICSGYDIKGRMIESIVVDNASAGSTVELTWEESSISIYKAFIVDDDGGLMPLVDMSAA